MLLLCCKVDYLMTAIFTIMISFFLVHGTPSSADTVTTDSTAETTLPDTILTDSTAASAPEAGQVHRTLTADEFVTIYVSLTRILDECAGDRDLFEQKRDRFLSRMGVTREQLFDFVTSKDKNPVFWSSLWQNINDQLQPLDSLTTETGE